MEENQERPEDVVINSNILFSSLIREEGFTRAALLFLKDTTGLKFIVPKTVVREFKLHIGEISRKSRLNNHIVRAGLEKLLENVEQVNETDLEKEMRESLQYVKDENDAPFAAVALRYRPAYILTYNKKHYITGKLKELGIKVVTPKEALDLIGIEKMELETKEKKKKNFLSYLARLKIFPKR